VALSLERGSSVTVPGELVRHKDAVSLVRLLMKRFPDLLRGKMAGAGDA
jgi:hypothetical protein